MQVYEASLFYSFSATSLLLNVSSDSLLSEVLDHQVAAYVKGDFLSNFLYILIISKRQIPRDDLSKLNFC